MPFTLTDASTTGPVEHPPADLEPTGADLADLTDHDLTDEELASLALAAADELLPDDAVSLWDLEGDDGRALLPEWYMPVSPGGTRGLQGWRRTLAWVLVATFLAIDGIGLCSAYGPILMGR